MEMYRPFIGGCCGDMVGREGLAVGSSVSNRWDTSPGGTNSSGRERGGRRGERGGRREEGESEEGRE